MGSHTLLCPSTSLNLIAPQPHAMSAARSALVHACTPRHDRRGQPSPQAHAFAADAQSHVHGPPQVNKTGLPRCAGAPTTPRAPASALQHASALHAAAGRGRGDACARRGGCGLPWPGPHGAAHAWRRASIVPPQHCCRNEATSASTPAPSVGPPVLHPRHARRRGRASRCRGQ